MKNLLSGNSKPDGAPRFELGRVVATPGALALMHRTNSNPFFLLARHVAGDWGECCAEDAQANEDAVTHGSRVFSVYRLPLQSPTTGGTELELAPMRYLNANGACIWAITEADRSVTTLLLPEEY